MGKETKKIDDVLITPLKSMQVSELYAKRQNLDQSIQTGEFFNDLHIKKLLIRSFLLWRVQIINIFLS